MDTRVTRIRQWTSIPLTCRLKSLGLHMSPVALIAHKPMELLNEVRTVKTLLNKSADDPYAALLAYRATPLETA